MNILIIAKDLENIRKELSSRKEFQKHNLRVYDNAAHVDDIDLFDFAVFDICNLNTAAQLYKNSSSFKNFYLWINGKIVSSNNQKFFDNQLKYSFENKDWNMVKKINKIKILINLVMKKEILDTYPMHLQIESTSYCNAQCIMCQHCYSTNANSLDMDDDYLVKIKELLPYLELIIMHGNGEPFVSKLFNKSIDLYSDYAISLSTNTNLSIFNDLLIEKINKSFVDFRVSCDGCTKEIYEGIRKNLSFEKFVHNCEMLKRLDSKIRKTMCCVLMRQNIEQLPEIVKFAKKYDFDEIIFSDLGTSLIINNEFDRITNFPYYASKQLNNAIKMGKTINIKVTIPSTFDLTLNDINKEKFELDLIRSRPFFKSENEIERIRAFAKSVVGNKYRVLENLADCYWDQNLYKCDGICDWVIEKPFIDLHGDVFVCCRNNSYKIGNIFEHDSFMEIWNNDTYRKIRNLFYSGKLPGFCDNCSFVLNGSLKYLTVNNIDDRFYNQRHISKFYHDYCKDKKNGR